jgi:hypothetical protein
MIKNNLEWTQDLPLLEFLGSVGRVARVSTMLARDRLVTDPFFFLSLSKERRGLNYFNV